MEYLCLINFPVPKKLLSSPAVPTLILERLRTWGLCIRKQRIAQKIRAGDLCDRMGIARTTLRRLERGEPGAAVDLYLNALLILGIMDAAVPALSNSLWEMRNANSRTRLTATEGDDDDF